MSRARTIAWLGVLLAWSAPATSFAQDARNGFQLDRYLIPMQANDLFWTERASTTPHLRVGALLGLGYQRSPLTVRDAATGSASATLVENDLRAQAALSLGLFDRAQVGIALPVVVFTDGNGRQPSGATAPTSFALGDLRADLRIRLLGENAGRGFRLAVASAVFFPTGSRGAYASDGSVSGNMRLLAEYEASNGIRVDANVGIWFRPTIAFTTPYAYTVDDEAFARLGVALPLTSERNLLATVELAGATAVAYSPGTFARYYTQLEAMIGAKYISDSAVFIGIGAGAGLTDGVGTPDARLVVMVGRGYADPVAHATRPGDDDRDGVINQADTCPRTPMGEHPDPDRRGCPSQDDDRDGYINQLDNCPTLAAGPHPDLDRVGCPLGDEDRDGVFDARDACPSVPQGEHPDASRRGCPLADNDADGVPDVSDACPAQPAGEHVDPERAGCPDPDRDHDAVPNGMDACPGEPGEASADPVQNGCPRWVRLREGQIVLLEPIAFSPAHDTLAPRAIPLLQEVARVLLAHPELREVRIEAHGRGGVHAERSLDVAAQRAALVRAWLVEHGVGEERVTTVTDDGAQEPHARVGQIEFVVIEPQPVASAGGNSTPREMR